MKKHLRELLQHLFADPHEAREFFETWLRDRPGVDLDAVPWNADRTTAMRRLVDLLFAAGYTGEPLLDALAVEKPGQRERIEAVRSALRPSTSRDPKAAPGPARQEIKGQLARLLVRLLGAGELRREVAYRFGEELVAELPGEIGSHAGLASAVLDELDRRGQLGSPLFTWLREKRPKRAEDIDALARVWTATEERAPGQVT